MQSALHITTKVLPGNRIEIQLPPLTEGEEVEVFVVLPSSTTGSTLHSDQTDQHVQVAASSIIPAELVRDQSAEALSRIRSRPRVNPLDVGLIDSTILIREDRDR